MSEKELKSTTVIIGGRSYPVRVEESQIRNVQSAGKKINEKVRYFQSIYKDRDLQDCLSMALLTFAMDIEQSDSSGQTDDLTEHLRNIDRILQDALN